MLYKATPLELIDVSSRSSGQKEFTAYASTFGNEDLGGDIIDKGAFARTLRQRPFRPLLWQHNMSEPIGVEKSIREDGKGLLGTWELLDTQRGSEAYTLLKAGAVRSMSIGYIPGEFSFEEEGKIRRLTDVELLENSVVSLPMNEQARVQSVKELSPEILARIVKSIYEAEIPVPVDGRSSYSEMSLLQLSQVAQEVLPLLREHSEDLVRKLSEGGHELTDAKRSDLTALLETFSGLDAVRTNAETLLRQKAESAPETADEPTAPNLEIPSGKSALALAIELRRARARRAGVI